MTSWTASICRDTSGLAVMRTLPSAASVRQSRVALARLEMRERLFGQNEADRVADLAQF